MKDKTRIRDYVKLKEFRNSTPQKTTKDGDFRIYQGVLITEKQFNEMFPLRLRPDYNQLENPDKTSLNL